jgi:lysophospholipase L1-like esterase
MKSTLIHRIVLCTAATLAMMFAAVAHSADDSKLSADAAKGTATKIPTLFIVGDSTVKNGAGNRGWGEVIGKMFDQAKIKVDNRAIAGRSSRTFINEGKWDRILADSKPGDFVIVQMGHNDGGPINDIKGRGSLKGTGEETEEIDSISTKKHEVVHTYGWYLRKYIADAHEKGMAIIICSPVPHRPKQKVEGDDPVEKSNYVVWSKEVADKQGVPFVDLNRLIMQKYKGMEPAEIKTKYFSTADDTHTNEDGAELNAACVIEGLRGLKDCPLTAYVSKEAKVATPSASEKTQPTKAAVDGEKK